MSSRPLSEAPYGATVTVVDSHATPSQRRRLAEIGIRPGAQIQVLHPQHGGGRVLGVAETRVALGLDALASIWVSHDQPTAPVAPVSPGTAATAVLAPAVSAPEPVMTLPPTAGGGCHPAPVAPTGTDAPRVALVGAPNSGKSTLFTMLSGAAAGVGNWPGTTVEVGHGTWQDPALVGPVAVLDLPGAPSLEPLSPDEALTRDLVTGAGQAVPDLAVVVVDAAHLPRSLVLLAQIRELPLRTVVALTMSDVAARRGLSVDADALADAVGCPVVVLDPRRRAGRQALAAAVAEALARPPAPARPVADAQDELAVADDRFGWVERAVAAATERGELPRRRSWSDRLDRVLLAPWAGLLVFLAVMWAVFQVTTTVAAPLQEALGWVFSGPVTAAAQGLLGAIGLDGTWVEGLLVDGLVAGVGMLLTFVPLMTLMFLLLALLEDSGYLARAAVVTDRVMQRLGLPGQAFLPLVVGFGCNVPAIAATRILPHPRQRLLTVLLVPFTSCSARLTVYVLLATTFFPGRAGTVVFVMYVVSILLVVLVGLLLRSTLWRALGSDPLVLVLPPYQRPTVRVVGAVTWRRLRGFLQTASGIIVATVTVVWLLQAVPAGGGRFGAVAVEDSLYGALARALSPIFSGAGFGHWELVSALAVGFVAKEAVISSWAQTFAVADPGAAGSPGALGDALHLSFAQASGGHPTAAVAAFMVFLLAYTPCMATLAAQKREVGLRWTLVGLGVQLAVAWALAVVVFQIGRLLG